MTTRTVVSSLCISLVAASVQAQAIGGRGDSDCCIPHDTPGCDDGSCEAAVCDQDPFCCSPVGHWDSFCVIEALVFCGDLCEQDCPDGESCDDGDLCTENDQCLNGVCTGPPINCNDANPCTDDDCDPDAGCTHTPNNDPCDDGDECTENDHCGEDGCVHGGGPTDCNDGNACTDDGCDSDTGCTHEDIDCDDGIPCTEDSCDSGSGCVNIPSYTLCDDFNECTVDICDPLMGCVHVPVPEGGPADDGNNCTEGDTCVDGAPSGTPVQCPKGQVCDPTNGECVDDQDPCECINGRVTLCHIPPGNLGNAHTITVGCAARDRHLAHGDHCGPCEDGDG